MTETTEKPARKAKIAIAYEQVFPAEVAIRESRSTDYVYALKRPYWYAYEAAAFLSGYKATKTTGANIRKSESLETIDGICHMIFDDIDAGHISDAMRPVGWVEWAKRRGLANLPSELVALAQKSEAHADAKPGTEEVGAGNRATAKEVKPKQDIGEPFLQQYSRNSRAAVEKWVAWQAQDKLIDGDTTKHLAGRIFAIAEANGYQSERGELTVASITKMLPSGLTGGRGKNRGIKSKK